MYSSGSAIDEGLLKKKKLPIRGVKLYINSRLCPKGVGSEVERGRCIKLQRGIKYNCFIECKILQIAYSMSYIYF